MNIIEVTRTVIKHCATTSDGESYDVGRLLWIAGVFVFFGLCFYTVNKSHAFDPIAYGTGFGALMAGCGAALGLKNKTEPQ